MINLMRADLYRATRSIVFFICLGLVFVTSAWVTGDIMVEHLIHFQGEVMKPTHLMLHAYSAIGIVSIAAGLSAAFITGGDFDGGNIRNKIYAGRSKAGIYLSNMINSFFIALMYLLLHLTIVTLCFGFGFGWAYAGRFFGYGYYVKLLLMSLLHAVAIQLFMTSLGCACAMTVEKKFVALIIFAVVFVLLVYFNDGTHEYAVATNETIVGYEADWSQGDENVILTKLYEDVNPYFSQDEVFKVKCLILDSISAPYHALGTQLVYAPTAQSAVFPGTELIIWRYPVSDCVMTMIFSLFGYTIFKNRNMK